MSLIGRNQRFGSPSAEQDELIKNYEGFYDTRDFETIADFEDRRTFVIGRTESGKSACFYQLEKSYRNSVASINPRSFALQHILNTSVIDWLREHNVYLDPFFYSLWTHVIIVAIIRLKFPQKESFTVFQVREQLRDFFYRRNCREALQYVEQYGDIFWETQDVQISNIIDQLNNKISAEFSSTISNGQSSISGNLQGSKDSQITVTKDVTSRSQLIVNEAIVKRMNAVVKAIDDHVLSSQSDFIYITIDDLDKDWVDTNLSNLMIRCLFDVVLDLTQHISNLKIVVALRTNLFQQLDLSKAFAQEEKYNGQILNLRWREQDIRQLLKKRLEAVSTRYKIDPPWELNTLLPRKTPQHDSVQYILDRTLLRPRDAIVFLNECLVEATDRERIRQEDIHAAESKYSHDRLDALRDEWKNPYLDLDKILNVFRQRPAELRTNEIMDVFNNIALLLYDDQFEGKKWLDPLCRNIENHKTVADDNFPSLETWYDYYGGLFRLLFDIGFLGFTNKDRNKTKVSIIYSYMEEHRVQQAEEWLGSIVTFNIHPAFCYGLGITH